MFIAFNKEMKKNHILNKQICETETQTYIHIKEEPNRSLTCEINKENKTET